MASSSEILTRPPASACHITVDTEGLFHHDYHGIDRGPYRSLAEALAALRRRSRTRPGDLCAEVYGELFPLVRGSLLPRSPWSGWEYHLTLKGGLFDVHNPDIGGPFQDLGEALAAVERHRASLTPPPAAQASVALSPSAEASVAPEPAAEASVATAPAAEASSNPPPADEEDWRKEEREKGRALKLYLSQLDPDEYLRSAESMLALITGPPQKDTKPAKQPVEKSWMDTVIEKLTPTTTDPDILKARYRFERLVEERETIKNGMKWMRKEVLKAFESYKSSAGYNKNFEYDFVRLDFQCLIYGTFSKSYHHYNFTMRTRLSRSKPWTYQRYFAQVKPTENGTEYFCCPLQPSEDGDCFGCRKVGVSLRHPESGGYEKGHPGSGFPFDTDSESDD